MKKSLYVLLCAAALVSCGQPKQQQKAVADVVTSGNPIFEGWYADPEGIVYGDTYWIYPTYSDRYELQTHFDCFSSKDLVNWTKHESILDTTEVKWAKRAMWAPAVISKDGKYYPVQDFNEYKPTLYIANQSLMHVINKNIVRPVGFQAVMRPLLQTAFALNMTSENKDILSNFIEIELPQRPEVALAIYRSFNDGRDIFPDEPVMSLKNIVRERRELNEGLFKQYCREYKKPEAVLREKLEENFRITNTLPFIEPEMFTKMTSEVYDKLIPWIKENISYRKCRYADENNPNAYQDLFPKSLV